jgi:RNA polymerase sigma factor (sigma-70 family)
MEYINEISKHHKDWIRSVSAYGEKNYTEDIVQEMYLQLVKYKSEHKAFDEDGNFNKNYIYRTLFNMTHSFKKSKKNLKKVSIGDGFDIAEDESDYSLLENLQKLDNAIESLNWYDKKLIDLHHREGIPMREIGRDSGLGYSSISRTLSKAKQKLKTKIYE